MWALSVAVFLLLSFAWAAIGSRLRCTEDEGIPVLLTRSLEAISFELWEALRRVGELQRELYTALRLQYIEGKMSLEEFRQEVAEHGLRGIDAEYRPVN